MAPPLPVAILPSKVQFVTVVAAQFRMAPPSPPLTSVLFSVKVQPSIDIPPALSMLIAPPYLEVFFPKTQSVTFTLTELLA